MVVEAQPVCVCVIPYPVPNPVVDVVHQLAVLYWKYLVERTGCVEAYCTLLCEVNSRGYFLVCQPFLVAETEFQLVPVFLSLGGTNDRFALR